MYIKLANKEKRFILSTKRSAGIRTRDLRMFVIGWRRLNIVLLNLYDIFIFIILFIYLFYNLK